jgi:hypothetical protein
MRRFPLAPAAFIVAQSAACTVPSVPAKLPPEDHAWIAVFSGELPEAVEQVARHAWIVSNLPGQTQVRWELMGSAFRAETRDPFTYFGDGDVAVHGIVEGSVEEISRIRRCLDAEVGRYNERHPTYWPIPGPNSNTFIAESLRHCGIHVELPSTCIGRDYRGPIGAGVTESGTGVQLESWVAGVRVGLREGVEGHVTGLALGVHAWPPGITVPVNPGRIGIDLDGHVPSSDSDKRHWFYDERRYDSMRERRYGVAVAQMFASVARIKRPEDAGGLAERATVGLSGQALYAKRHLAYAIATDFELGMGFPAGFAYSAHVYPAGIGWTVGPTGYVALLGGVGASGVTARVPGGLELPVEARAEVDAGRRVRLGLRAAAVWVPAVEERQGGSTLSFADELVLATFVRIGRARTTSFGTMGRGHFFGLERHEVMHTFWLGLSYGVEIDFGG